MSMLYLAYGSNLNKSQMRQRCPTARPVGTIMLEDAKLVFRGVADCAPTHGSFTPCGLWLVNTPDIRALDAYEGVSRGLYKKEKIKVLRFGKQQDALIYLMESEGIFPPRQSYVDTIRQGYKDFGLDTAYLDQAIAWTWEHKKPDEQTERRRKRQKLSGDTMLVRLPAHFAERRPAAANGHNLETRRQALEDKILIESFYDSNRRPGKKSKRENLDDYLRRAKREGIPH